MRLSGMASLATAVTLTTGILALPTAAADAGSVPQTTATDASVIRLHAERGSDVRSAEVPVTAASSGPRRTSPYSMVGFTWAGSDPVLRVRSQGAGGWSAWRTPEVLEDGPTSGTEGVATRATHLLWVGASYGVQVEARGAGHRDLTLVLIDPGATPAAATALGRRTAQRATAQRTTERRTRPARAPVPPLRSRREWGANNAWRNGTVTYNTRLRQVHVHHTASGNDYTRADVPAILRGMYRYHTKSLGWFDLGYNFVVDRFGRTWTGRSGGPTRLVRGAHTLGFNHNSVGIAVLGNFERLPPTRRAVTAVVRIAAWKLDRYRRDAAGRVAVRSEGSDRYAKGRRVRLFVVDGHRDTNQTACPGARLYSVLPAIRRRAQARIDRYDPR
jgi:hypothetical protein